MKNDVYSIYESDDLTDEEIAILEIALDRLVQQQREYDERVAADPQPEDDVLLI
jgi:hypothetical protein